MVLMEKYGNGDSIDYTYNESIGRLVSQKVNGIESIKWTNNIDGSITSFTDIVFDDPFTYSHNKSSNIIEKKKKNTKSDFGISFNAVFDDGIDTISYKYCDVVKIKATTNKFLI
ncbi:hypothetical protein H8356DRAFT_1430589 [Neocallimastix lanati (nom. inval.)]|nr:hypothetical protein H8356DRAFT_1430589 [Neocallimastix sp. JGI-2020a]